jgi:uncharacterized membrane protein SirB2
MNLYDSLKLLHILCVLVSILFFVYRYQRLLRYPEQRLSAAMRVLPHINDTVLLAAAIGMLVVLRLNPISAPWLLIKIAALLVYIVLGSLCFRAMPGARAQQRFFVLALLTFVIIVSVALGKFPS